MTDAAIAAAALAASPTAQAVVELAQETEVAAHRHDRLLSGLVLITAIALILGAPFALKAGATFFVPVVAALVIALVLIPALEWLERRGLPSGAAALAALAAFIVVANGILVAIVVPAIDWVQLLPERVGQVRANLEPVLATFAAASVVVDRFAATIGTELDVAAVAASVAAGVVAIVSSAPVALLQTFFTLLLTFFFLSTYTEVRGRVIGARTATMRSIGLARLARDVIRNTAAYIFTISVVNVALGAAVALMAWAIGLPTPLMWGGFAALFNFVPYVGPLFVAFLLLIGGLIAFASPLTALLPAIIFIGLHLVEANFITPRLIGRRVAMSPLAILVALSFWGWVWGTVGALIAVPLLIMGKVFLDHVGTPDLVGFLFRDGSLVHSPETQ